MRYRSLGAGDLKVSEIGFAVEPVTSGPIGDDEVLRLIRLAWDLGVTFFDAAGRDERSEELLGRAVRPFREPLTLATKFGWVKPPPLTLGQQGTLVQDWSARAALDALDASLRRLGTEPVDLFQLHDPDMEALDTDELFDFLSDQVTKGKIRAYGVVLGSGTGWADVGHEAMRECGVSVAQVPYNLVEPEPGGELVAAAAESEARVVARAADADGLLDGAARLEFLTRDRDQTLRQAALKFALAPAAVASALPTLGDDRRLAEAVAAVDKPDLTDEDLARLAELSADGSGARPSGQGAG
jgi:aryl-alcohol dehydrogenase-like predicted oxidoreductase